MTLIEPSPSSSKSNGKGKGGGRAVKKNSTRGVLKSINLLVLRVNSSFPFSFFFKKEKYPWHFRLLRILPRHSQVPGISVQERMDRELGGAGSGRSRQRRHRASCFPVSPKTRHDGEAPKLTKHTDYYPLVESLTTLFQGIAALAFILFGQVARGALN